MKNVITRVFSLLFPAALTPAHADVWQQRALGNGTPPVARHMHTAVWTGSEMIVWGGFNGTYLNSGGRYNPTTDTWTEVSTVGAPAGRTNHTAVWTGSEMIIWGGGSSSADAGGRYSPGDNSWRPISLLGSPAKRENHTAVWTGSEMIVWGGHNGTYQNTGGRYDPATDTWRAMATAGAPAGRINHTAVWTGSEMIVWGGAAADFNHPNDTGRYVPGEDVWVSPGAIGQPIGRADATAVWTGNEIIVWGGISASMGPGFQWHNTGGRYYPTVNSWAAVNQISAPGARALHTAVWTGREMIVWGGNFNNEGGAWSNGGRYDPDANAWLPVSQTGAPGKRYLHSAVWTGSQMLVWGGRDGTRYLNDTFSYTPEPVTTDFRITSAVLDNRHFAVSFPSRTGRTYTLWSSSNLQPGSWNDTGLAALPGTGGTLTFTVAIAPDSRDFFRVQADP